jgi:hypothetical protein
MDTQEREVFAKEWLCGWNEASYFERGLASSPGKIEFEFLGVFHGSLAGEGTCRVAADGTTMTASTSGFDSQLQSFTMTVLK